MVDQIIDAELVGEGVKLRLWRRRDNDVDELWQRQADPLSHLWNIQPAQHDQFPSISWPAPGNLWAICDRQGTLIGRLSLRQVDREAGVARLGITLIPSRVGRGLGTEAMRLFLTHYFGALGFRRMVLDVAAINRRAVRCYERLNFRHVGSEWRYAGRDATALELLETEAHAADRAHFRASAQVTGALELEFYEMELTADEWRAVQATGR